MKFCPRCGLQLDDSVNFCPVCGLKQPKWDLSADNVATPPEPLPTASMPEQDPVSGTSVAPASDHSAAVSENGTGSTDTPVPDTASAADNAVLPDRGMGAPPPVYGPVRGDPTVPVYPTVPGYVPAPGYAPVPGYQPAPGYAPVSGYPPYPAYPPYAGYPAYPAQPYSLVPVPVTPKPKQNPRPRGSVLYFVWSLLLVVFCSPIGTPLGIIGTILTAVAGAEKTGETRARHCVTAAKVLCIVATVLDVLLLAALIVWAVLHFTQNASFFSEYLPQRQA